MKQDLFKNITVITGGFLVIGLIFELNVLIYIATVVSMGSVLIPPLGHLINWLWMKLAFGLGWVNSRVLLSLIYYVFLFPIALVSRIFKKDSLLLKKDPKSTTYFECRDHTYTKEDLENIW